MNNFVNAIWGRRIGVSPDDNEGRTYVGTVKTVVAQPRAAS
jgi:hypothetical protein